MASCDRSHDKSWHLRLIVRLVVPPVAKSCDKSGQVASSLTTERDILRRVAPPIVRWHDQWHDQSCHWVIRDHRQVVVRPGKTYMQPLTIWSRRLELLNMTTDLAATDFALAITHDICDQSCVRSTICSRFHHFPFTENRNLVVSPVLCTVSENDLIVLVLFVRMM